ncbi:hypothetical protein GCM10009104_17260 [Marinobacterium maritimum]|uniref:Uncharacterized protein n=1 Tax=Marinobacterium maritimum TaxID=500162 RepID=A0ABN1I5W1_9GAMM
MPIKLFAPGQAAISTHEDDTLMPDGPPRGTFSRESDCGEHNAHWDIRLLPGLSVIFRVHNMPPLPHCNDSAFGECYIQQ